MHCIHQILGCDTLNLDEIGRCYFSTVGTTEAPYGGYNFPVAAADDESPWAAKCRKG